MLSVRLKADVTSTLRVNCLGFILSDLLKQTREIELIMDKGM